MDTGEHFKNNADYESQISAVFGRMRKRKDPLISALNQRVLGSSPSASTKNFNKINHLQRYRGGRISPISGLRNNLRNKFQSPLSLLARQIFFHAAAERPGQGENDRHPVGVKVQIRRFVFAHCL